MSQSGSSIPEDGPVAQALPTAQYDPSSGAYIGPDGGTYSQPDLTQPANPNETWQTMLMPGS